MSEAHNTDENGTAWLIEVGGGEDAAPVLHGSNGLNPFVACWGSHRGPCVLATHLTPDGGPHRPVVQLDYDDPAHRMLLRWLRSASALAHPVKAVPRTPAERTQT